VYADYVRQVDMRAEKILRFGHTRTLVGIDLYNVFNQNPALTVSQNFAQATATAPAGGTWLNPTSLLMPRFVRFNVTVDF